MSEKLLPCPFCGGTDLSVQTYDVQPDNYHGGYVTCIDCDAQGAGAITLNGWLGSPEEASNAAVTAWNTRAAMQADAAPVAWMYERGPETIILQGPLHRDGVLRGATGWTETPLYAHPPVDDRVSTSSPVDVTETPETSGKLRDAREVYQQAYVTWVSGEHADNAAAYQAAAAVIEADRAALVAAIVADLRHETRTYKGSEYSGFAAMIAEDISAKWGGK